MKKFFVFALATVVVSCLLLAACAAPTTTAQPTQTSAPAPTSGPTPEKPIELNFSYDQPPQSGFVKAILVPWATDLEKATGNRVKIVHHAAGSLLGGTQSYDGLLSGICDLAIVDPEKQEGRLPRGQIMMLPLVFPNGTVEAIAYHEWLLKYAVDTELKDVKLLITTPMPDQNYMGNKQVEKLEDFKGLKLRAQGKVDTSLVKALGASAISVTTEDAFSALDTGMVDGQFFSFEGALVFGFGDICKYKTECKLYESCFQILMNKKVYDKLPADIKKVFDDFSTPQVSKKYGADFMAMLPGATKALEGKDKAAGRPPIYILPEAERARWVTAVRPIVDEWIADMTKKGMPGQAMYDDLLSLVKKNSQ